MKKNKKLEGMGYDALLDRWKNGELIKNDYIYISDIMKQFEGSVEYRILRAFVESLIHKLHAFPKKAEDHSYVLGKLDGLTFINESVKILKKYSENIPKKEKEEEYDEVPIANDGGGSIE